MGGIDRRVIEKWYAEQRYFGSRSLSLAEYLTSMGSPRAESERGISIYLKLGKRLETSNGLWGLLDLPGWRDFRPTLIRGLSQVVLRAGFDRSG